MLLNDPCKKNRRIFSDPGFQFEASLASMAPNYSDAHGTRRAKTEEDEDIGKCK
jgi:hypothetical protein